jgi:23S rRNA pseudouridine1911/1915/1917 synthase
VASANYTPPPASGTAAEHALTVPAASAGMRLDQALAQLLPQHSRSRLKRWIDERRVTVDGAVVEPRFRLAGGEALVVHEAEPAADERHAAEAIALDIVFEDATILVVNKPPGLVVHPGNGNPDGTLLNALLHHAPTLLQVPRAGIVHRLDKDTSGLLVVARTVEAQTALVRQLAARTVKREYLAVARGDLERAVTIDAPIGRHPVQRTTMAVVGGGKAARTHVTPVERYGIATLVQCSLETGRTHQIRVHLAAIKHPLVGDATYGGKRAASGIPAFARQALHAWRLGLVHPVTGAHLQFEAPPPADFVGLRAALRDRRG